VDEADLSFHCNDFDGGVPHVDVKDGAGACQDVSERAGRLDDRATALIVETGNTGGDIHLGYFRIKVNELDLRAVPGPDPRPVGDDKFAHPLGSRKKRIARAERRVFDDGDPVILRRHIAKQVSLDMIDPAHQCGGRICGKGRGNYRHHRGKQNHQQCDPFLHCSLLFISM
jgi:hypothetical protein